MENVSLTYVLMSCLISFLAGGVVRWLVEKSKTKEDKKAGMPTIDAIDGLLDPIGKAMDSRQQAITWLAKVPDIELKWGSMVKGKSIISPGVDWVFLAGLSVFKCTPDLSLKSIQLQDVLDKINETKEEKEMPEYKFKPVPASSISDVFNAVKTGSDLWMHGRKITINKDNVLMLSMEEICNHLECVELREEVYDWTDHLGEGKLCKYIGKPYDEIAYKVLRKNPTGKLSEVYKNGKSSQLECLPYLWEPVSPEEAVMLCMD